MAVIWCLHGFLGRPSDWDFLRGVFEIRAVDLLRHGLDPLREARSDDFLLGYSMGARLAVRELLTREFRGAIIVSAGLNVEEASERAERMRHDEAWAWRFEVEDWARLIRDWNEQPIFAGEREPFVRLESEFSRRALAKAIREWSPAALEPMERRLAEITTPVLWIAGERDRQYAAVGERAVPLLPDAELWICPGAGHRVPWDQPEKFIDRVKRFVERGPDVDQPS